MIEVFLVDEVGAAIGEELFVFRFYWDIWIFIESFIRVFVRIVEGIFGLGYDRCKFF